MNNKTHYVSWTGLPGFRLDEVTKRNSRHSWTRDGLGDWWVRRRM